MLPLLDAFFEKLVIQDCSSRLKIARTLATSGIGDALYDLTANSKLGTKTLFTVFSIAFSILFLCFFNNNFNFLENCGYEACIKSLDV